MFEFIGFAVLIIFFVAIFFSAIIMAKVSFAFGSSGTAWWCIFWVLVSGYGMYKTFDASPYGFYNKNEQVLNDKNNTQNAVLHEQEKVQREQ